MTGHRSTPSPAAVPACLRRERRCARGTCARLLLLNRAPTRFSTRGRTGWRWLRAGAPPFPRLRRKPRRRSGRDEVAGPVGVARRVAPRHRAGARQATATTRRRSRRPTWRGARYGSRTWATSTPRCSRSSTAAGVWLSRLQFNINRLPRSDSRCRCSAGLATAGAVRRSAGHGGGRTQGALPGHRRRLPEEQANRRRQKLIAEARSKDGRVPSKERLTWRDWTILITNVPADS